MADEIVAIVPRGFDEVKALATYVATSGLLPNALRKKPEDIALVVMTGAELGVPPMVALRGMDVINGQVAMRSAMIRGLVQRRRDICEYLTITESTAKVCTFETKRVGSPKPIVMSFTIEEARNGNLLGKDNWKKDPVAMLIARAGARICRAAYADLAMGLYDPDELDVGDGKSPRAAVEAQVTETHAAADLKAKLREEITDAEVVQQEALPEPSLADQIAAAPTPEDLRKLLPAVKASPDVGSLKEPYRARLAELAGG